jgi:hypothetical protein
LGYFLFFFWIIVLSWCLTKIKLVKDAGLGSKLIIALFVCKVFAGVASGWISHTAPDSDSWHYHTDGLTEYQLLFSNPKEYFTNLFYTGYTNGYEGILKVQNSYWNDLKDNVIIKLVSVLDIFSGGNFYVNVVLYNFITFFGWIGLYRVFKEVYNADKILTAMLVFLLPSVLFYGSTLHKDGLVMALTGVLVFNTWQMLQQNAVAAKRIIFIAGAIFFIFLFRIFLVMALLPAFFSWALAQKKKLSPFKTFAVVYAVTLVLFFSIHYVIPSLNLPAYMVQRQIDFIGLPKGNTTIQLDTLNTNPVSFLKTAPQALQHCLLRPFISDIKMSKLLLPLALELVFYELLIVLFLFYRRKNFSFNQPFVLFSLFFGLSLCLIIGYTVPVIGAIVRYRSIYLPFILAPFVLNIEWERLQQFFKIKK